MIKVIINADDFGRSVERNKAIDDAFKQGLIRSAGLIVTGKYLHDAIEHISKGEYIKDVHLHFNLSTSLRDGDPEDVPLTDAMKRNSFFCKDGRFKKYKGLPHSFSDIREWKIVYRELVAQYNRFVEVTNSKADYKHIDFHLWYNLTWPVSIALNLFARKYKIRTIRCIGMHQMNSRRYRLMGYISHPLCVKSVPATNIDFFLTKRDKFAGFKMIELYCHPNYKEGMFLDDSPSYLKHERQPMLKQFQMLREIDNLEFVSWDNVR